MVDYDFGRKDEYFEKCRALLKVLDLCKIPEPEKDALIWAARDYLELLGYATGIVTKK